MTNTGRLDPYQTTAYTNNTAIGWSPLKHITTGTNNTAIGAFALLHNIGNGNTATSAGELLSNIREYQNTVDGAA